MRVGYQEWIEWKSCSSSIVKLKVLSLYVYVAHWVVEITGNERKGQHTLLFLSHFLFTAFFFIFIYSRPPFPPSPETREKREVKDESTFFSVSSFSPPQTTADYSSRNKIDPVERRRKKKSSGKKSFCDFFSFSYPHTHTHTQDFFFACVIAVNKKKKKKQ